MNAVTINNLAKRYYISHAQQHYFDRSLRKDAANFLKNPFKLFTGTLDKKETIWAIKNMSFTVEKGETVGIIGKNGSGKSTLLKLIAQITTPTQGEIRLVGKIASLLDLGVGFHPELTGRENIFLSGAILGFTKREIEKEFNSIIAFSGIGKFIDTPVKYYSSGMYVRLAFSVATARRMEPEILLVDEILAVGDREFYKKSLARMTSLVKETSTTILFVSHNLAAIEKLCQSCIWLEAGKIKKIGSPKEVIEAYTKKKP